ncbi:MAG: dihydrodipicolinate synthase family protein [Chitinophagaceae bacterium]|nr:dihydrodipicolinate synthase family protein [Chitinophagaceae bacterium]
MEILSVDSLKGTWGTILLSVNADNSIDYGCLEQQLDFLCSSGISGIYSNGTAGEFFNQTEQEFDRIQLLMAEKCRRNNIPFQVGGCHMSPVVSMERIKRSRSLYPGAFQVIFPDWLPLTPEEQIVFLKEVSQVADPAPLVLYNPGHSKTVLQPKDFSVLRREIPSLIGIKVAAKGDDWLEAVKVHGEGLSVFIQGHRLASGIKAGIAKGSYSNIACLNPVGAVAWYQLMQEDIAEALIIENRIADFFENCIFPFAKAGYSDPALDKLLAFAGGWSQAGTRLRFPYKWVSQADALSVRQQAKKMLPELITRF